MHRRLGRRRLRGGMQDYIRNFMNSIDPELERLRFDYEEQLAWHRARDRASKVLMQARTRDNDLQTQWQLVNIANTEKAMLNLLEDARGLEEELMKQKAGVEQEVQQRTRELKEEQAKLAAAIQGLSFSFFMIDGNDRVIMVNSAAEKLFGRSDPALDWIAGQFGGAFDFLADLRRCREEKTVIDNQGVAYGSKFLRVFTAPIIMIRDHEEVIGAVVLFEDITEARLMERSREEFFAIASHELRTPLTAIRGNASMLRDMFGEKLDKDAQEMIADIYSGSIRLIGIVNDFLDVSRLEQKKFDFAKMPFDIVELAEKVVRGSEEMAQAKKLYLKVEKPADGFPMAFGDSERTEQIIFNLIGNAVHYTREGGITVGFENKNNAITVFVADTGIGISPQYQSRLFKKFQQAGEDALVRDVSKGTGLGLYISKLLADGMGGQLGLLKSELNKGSIFYLTLPAKS